MSLSPEARSAAIAARAEERGISLELAAQELSLAGNARRAHIVSTVYGLTLCGLSSFAMDCVDREKIRDATCKRCRRYLSSGVSG
jgi:hypothetical protein